MDSSTGSRKAYHRGPASVQLGMSLLEVDGSIGEGGGQILRTSLAMAALTGREVRVHNIRAGRPSPGLAHQHLTAASALADLCHAKTEGLALGSREVTFRPNGLRGGRYDVNVGTAGSVTLVTQAVLLPALHGDGPVHLRIRGGTDVKWSPPADYLAHIFLPLLEQMGTRVAWRVLRRGYYPRGGGEVAVDVEPLDSLRPLLVEEPGGPPVIRGVAHVANLPRDIAQRMKRTALRRLVPYPNVHVEDIVYGPEEAEGRGGAVVLWAGTGSTILGASALAERGVPAQRLGHYAAEALIADLRAGAMLDPYAADQLLPYLALAEGPSSFLVREISGHTQTMVWLLPQFLDIAVRVEPAAGLQRIIVRPTRT